MGYTIAENILGRASAAGVPVRAGAEIEVKPDYMLGYDFPGYLDLIFRQMKEEFGIERVAGEVRNLSRGGALAIAPCSTAERGMLQASGLIPYLRERLRADEGE